ncbi:hypothetical protein EVAR_17590_1 [Eumeta japonica]|uniref:Uncharacterized protein n=1 Tax=Eumeta variegata TaxID=151549 RepID=A0A4C1UBY9_EUMVA|nr:hypothetical protein EVAR_17590_1 [Eumeta japonica]
MKHTLSTHTRAVRLPIGTGFGYRDRRLLRRGETVTTATTAMLVSTARSVCGRLSIDAAQCPQKTASVEGAREAEEC